MTKPSKLPTWDETEVNSVEPDTTHQEEGWLAPGGIPEKPPFQTFNYWMNTVWKWIKAFNKQGIVEWDNVTTYDIDDISKGSNGLLYKSLSDENTNNDPIGDTVNWSNIQNELAPTGEIKAFAASSVPIGFLECDGTEISRSTFSSLFFIIGTTYGTGDGITTFNIPDLRGEFIRGWDNGRGADAGRNIGESQGDAIRNISGNFTGVDSTIVGGAFSKDGTYDGEFSEPGGLVSPKVVFDASTVVPTAEENRPRNIAVMYCIKY